MIRVASAAASVALRGDAKLADDVGARGRRRRGLWPPRGLTLLLWVAAAALAALWLTSAARAWGAELPGRRPRTIALLAGLSPAAPPPRGPPPPPRAPPARASGGSPAATLLPPDTSIRCRVSGICDHAASCDGVAADATRDRRFACVHTAAQRKAEVVEAIRWAWKGYVRCAWGRDELRPLSCGASDWFKLGLTIVDSLDTLMLAGLHQEVAQAADWVRASLDVGSDTEVNTFESTIRVMGGLLAATHLSGGDRVYSLPAVELALRLLAAFDTASGMPMSDVNLRTLATKPPSWTSASSLSEVATLSVEFTYAAAVANRSDLAEPAMRVWPLLHGIKGQLNGLAYHMLDGDRLSFASNTISFGSRADSYYEYQLKQWIFGGKRDALNLEMYMASMRGLRAELLATTAHATEPGLLYVREIVGYQKSPKMDHLVCFLPGLLALGHLHGVETAAPGDVGDLALAEGLMHTCYQMYKRTPTGLAPEIVYFNDDGVAAPANASGETGGGHFTVHAHDTHNLLRPETLESLFVLWRVTRNETYREWGWRIFRAFEMHSRVDAGGYTDLDSVVAVPAPRRDKMESFFVAETLKYALLLFEDPSVLPLTEFVFNTEAHSLPIIGSLTQTSERPWYLSGNEVPASLHGKQNRSNLVRQVQAFRAATAAPRFFPLHSPGAALR